MNTPDFIEKNNLPTFLFDKDRVLKYLPHREPFLFIDGIEGFYNAQEEMIEPGKNTYTNLSELVMCSVKGHYLVREDHPIFKGHFPGEAILPGVLHVELMAQVASFFPILARPELLKKSPVEVRLLGIDRARFKKPILPQYQVAIHSKLIQVRHSYLTFSATLTVRGELISSAEFLAWINLK